MRKIFIFMTLITLLLLTTFAQATYNIPAREDRLNPIEEKQIVGDPDFEFNYSKIKLDGMVERWGGSVWFAFQFLHAKKGFVILDGDYVNDRFDLKEGIMTIKPLFGETIILQPPATIYYKRFVGFGEVYVYPVDNIDHVLKGIVKGIKVYLE